MSRTGKKTDPAFRPPRSTAVIEATAEYKGKDPIDLNQPLYEVIDPDALNALMGHRESNQEQSHTTIQFTYNDCRVHVTADGSVEVSSPHSR